MGWNPNDEVTVLLVDDDSEQREYLSIKFMQQCKCRILSASCVDEALALLSRYRTDVIVTDFLMPEGPGTGVDLIKAISAGRRCPPVLMLTTGFVEFLPDEAFNQLATVFTKPFSAERLVTMALEKLAASPQLAT